MHQKHIFRHLLFFKPSCLNFGQIQSCNTPIYPHWSCCWVSTTVRQHLLDSKEMPTEKSKWGLHKIAICCLYKNIGSDTQQKTAVQPLISHLANHPSKMGKICCTEWEKQGWNHKQHSPLESYHWMSQSWLYYKKLHQFCANTRCCLENLLRVMTNRDRWWEQEWRESVLFGLVGFYGISTIIGYLLPNSVYTYISNIYMICKHFIDNILI